MNTYNTYVEFCKGFKKESKLAKRNLLVQNWIIKRKKYSHSLEFNDNLDDLCVNYNKYDGVIEDALDYVLDKARNSIFYIISSPNEKLVREEILTPVNKVKEISSKGMAWLSRKPGKTIRQKIKNSQSILSIKRRMTLDTTENRLFLAYIKEISKLLQYKKMYNNDIVIEEDDILYQKINSFIRLPEVLEIKKWENLPPNNTLLSDKNYRKIWDSWIELKKLDQIVKNISENLKEKESVIKKYDNFVLENKHNLKTQLPLFIDYDNFKIDSLKKILVKQVNLLPKELPIEMYEGTNMIATNLLSTSTSFYCEKGIIKQKNNIIEQVYETEDEKKYRIPCSNSNYLYMYDKNIKINTHSILTELDSNDTDNLQKLIQLYKNNVNYESISIIIPDAFDDFKIMNLNKISRVYYKKIKMIPKSIAAMYALDSLDSSFRNIKIDSNVIVFDIVENKLTYTLLQAKENEYLKANKKYNKILWERIATNYIKSEKIFDNYINEIKDILEIKNIENLRTILKLGGISGLTADFLGLTFRFEEEEIIFNKENLDKIYECSMTINKEILKEIKREFQLNNSEIIYVSLHKKLYIDKKENIKVITLKERELLQGCYQYFTILKELNYLKDKYDNFTLWRDYLPDLGIKLIDKTFELTNKQTIIPIIGKEKRIEINDIIILPKEEKEEKKEYKFDLLKKDISEKEYEIVLSHSIFPLKEDLECKVLMIYRYGNEFPIELIFKPINYKDISIVAKWKKKEIYDYKNLYVPIFPEEELDEDRLIGFENIFDSTLNNLVLDKSKSLIDKKLYKKDNNYYLCRNSQGNFNSSSGASNYQTLFYKEHNFEYSVVIDEWIYNTKKGNYFARKDLFLKDNYYEVIINQNNFLDKSLFSSDIKNIKFDVKFKDYYLPINIMPINFNLYDVYEIEEGIVSVSKKNKGYLLAGLHYIFKNGRTIKEIKNNDFVDKFYKFKNKIIERYENDSSDTLLMYIMSLCYKEFGKYYYDLLTEEKISKMRRKEKRDLAYSLGEFTSLDEMNLYDKLWNSVEEEMLIEILAISIWKNRKTIYNLPKEDIKKLFDKAIITVMSPQKQNKIKMLEFIYGVFRLRTIADDELLKFLSKNNKKLKKLQNYLQNENLFLKESRIKFEIETKKKPIDMHDLVYAVLVCIYGSKNEEIRITQIYDEE